MNSPSFARSFYQQHKAKQILTRFVASFFFIYYIYIQASKSVDIHKYKQIKRTEPVHQAQKKKNSPSHVKSSLIFSPWNKSWALTHVQPKRKKHTACHFNITARTEKAVRDPDSRWSKGHVVPSHRTGEKPFLREGRGNNKINKSRPFLCVTLILGFFNIPKLKKITFSFSGFSSIR